LEKKLNAVYVVGLPIGKKNCSRFYFGSVVSAKG